MTMKAMAFGLLVLLPQLGFLWTEVREPGAEVPVEWEIGELER